MLQLCHQAALMLLVLMTAMGVAVGDRSQEFADDLEKCIRDHAAEAVRTLPTIAESCTTTERASDPAPVLSAVIS